MLLDDVTARLRIALTTVLVDEYGLLGASTRAAPPSERAFAAQLAQRLRGVFESSWDVDVEYNRADLGSGTITKHGGGTHRVADVLVHRRGLRGREHNLLLLELKVSGLKADERAEELHRLRCLQAAHEYRHTGLLDLGVRHQARHETPRVLVDPTLEWFDPLGPRPLTRVYATDAVARAVSRRGHEGWLRRCASYGVVPT